MFKPAFSVELWPASTLSLKFCQNLLLSKRLLVNKGSPETEAARLMPALPVLWTVKVLVF